MVDSGNNKKVWVIAGALGGLVAAALAWHYFSDAGEGDDAPEEITADELMEKLKEKGLDQVKRNNGMIEGNYFIQLLQFIGETNKARLSESRASCSKRRREAFKKDNMEEYAEIVKASFQEEDKSAQEIMMQVATALQIGEMEFQQTHQAMASDPQKAEMVMAAQQGKYT
jgi:hypothetical protein